MTVTVQQGMLVRDDREFYSVVLPDGRRAETKAHSQDEANKIIERILAEEETS